MRMLLRRRIVATIALTMLLTVAASGKEITTTYYIDSQDGNDLNTGRSAAAAWKSHTKAQQTKFLPGDVVMFKRGSQFSGPVHITQSGTPAKPIVLTAYGEGPAPKFTNPDDRNMNGNCIRISGSHVIIERLHFHDTPPTRHPDRVTSIFRMGAVFNMHGACHNVIRHNTFKRCTKDNLFDNHLDGTDPR